MGFKDEGVYTDGPQPYGEIFVMPYDGTEVEQLTDNQWELATPQLHQLELAAELELPAAPEAQVLADIQLLDATLAAKELTFTGNQWELDIQQLHQQETVAEQESLAAPEALAQVVIQQHHA